MNELKMIAYAEGFTIEEFTDGLEVTHNDSTLMAFIDHDNHIKYYRTDVQEHEMDCAEIDIDVLFRLKALCEEIKSRNVGDRN